MPEQPSGNVAGKLFVVGTPIGNLDDITVRAINTLKSADLIACEDTRETSKLLRRYQVETPTISYHEHNEMTRAPELILRMEQGGTIALVSDAGTPILSDPGYRLVHLAIRHKIPVVPIPGPSALVTALAAAGLPLNEFLFAGFLPARRAARVKALRELAQFGGTLIFYEAPHRIAEMLDDVSAELGEREIVIARELTKIHEEFLRGPVSEILSRIESQPVKGELTVIVGPGSVPAKSDRGASVRDEVESLKSAEGLDERSALKAVARARGISRSEAYRLLQIEKNSL